MSSRKRSEGTPPEAAPLVVLVTGEHDTLRDAVTAELARLALGSGLREFNEDRFDFANAGVDAARVLDAARTLPVQARQRLVRVRGLADKRARPFLEGPLLEYLEAPISSTCLLLEAAKVDRRVRWVKRVAQVGAVRDCTAPKRTPELRRWIDERIRSSGKHPGAGAAQALLDRVGPDLDRLAHEAEKAALFVGDGAEVSADDVGMVTGEVRPLAMWDLTDAIGSRDLPGALRLAGRLLDQGEAPLALLGALANHFRRLLRARECQPLEPREVARALSLHPYVAGKLVEQLRRFDLPRLRASLAAIRGADDAIKGGSGLPPRLAFERLVLGVSA